MPDLVYSREVTDGNSASPGSAQWRGWVKNQTGGERLGRLLKLGLLPEGWHGVGTVFGVVN